MKKFKSMTTAAAAAGVVGALAFGGAAHAESADSLTAAQLQEVSSSIDEAIVPVAPDDKQAILKKLSNGEVLDSMNESQAPVSVTEHASSDWTAVKYRYADGSYSVTATEVGTAMNGDIAPRTITDCTYSTSGAYQLARNCTVEFSDPISVIRFKADYRFLPGIQGNGQIDNVYGVATDGVGVVAGSGYANIVTANGNPAIAEAGLNYTTVVGGGTAVGLLYVDSGGARQSSWPY